MAASPWRCSFLVAVLAAGASRADAQVPLPPNDSRSGMLREAMLGLLPSIRRTIGCRGRTATRSSARGATSHRSKTSASRALRSGAYSGRIRHGVRIDPRTLRGEAGFYGDADPNCCPSQTLIVDLTVRRDALVRRAPPRIRPAQQ